VEQSSRNTLLVRKRKISGLAGAVKYGAILVHGSILIHSDLRVLYEVLDLNRMAMKVDGVRKYTRSQRHEVTNLEDVLGRRISLTELKRTLAKAFENQFSMRLKEDCLNESEEELVRKLYEHKYSSNHWNLKYSTLYETA
jgi:lipoate-protein ligase A